MKSAEVGNSTSADVGGRSFRPAGSCLLDLQPGPLHSSFIERAVSFAAARGSIAARSSRALLNGSGMTGPLKPIFCKRCIKPTISSTPVARRQGPHQILLLIAVDAGRGVIHMNDIDPVERQGIQIGVRAA